MTVQTAMAERMLTLPRTCKPICYGLDTKHFPSPTKDSCFEGLVPTGDTTKSDWIMKPIISSMN
jgi:hypothetical protein